mgnify:CR=1 FL=1
MQLISGPSLDCVFTLTRVSNRMGQCNFSDKGDRSFFFVLDKGTTGQAKNITKGREGLGSLSKSKTGRRTEGYEILTACPVPGDKTGQSKKGRSKTEKDVLKQEMTLLFLKFF